MKPILVMLLLLTISVKVWSQKSMNLDECEQAFLKNNLQLLAQHYGIDMAKAAVIQAKIWDLPYLTTGVNAINSQNNKWFDVGGQADVNVAVQQLIYLGGKKRKEVAVAKSNEAIATLQFEQLLASLKYQLRQSFYTVYFEQKKIEAIKLQKANIDTLLSSYSEQANKGNIPLKEAVRLQSLSLNFNNDRLTLLKGILSEKENLKILTGINEPIIPTMDEDALMASISHDPILSKSQMVDSALAQNPDYQAMVKAIEVNELTVKWQKSLAIPDLTLGTTVDQSTGPASRQLSFTVGIPLPLWNKNKGNIMLAKAQLEQAKLQKDQKAQELKIKIETAYDFRKTQFEQYRSVNPENFKSLELVYKGELKNIAKRNVSLIEFTDFMDSYNQSIMNINEMRKQIVLSSEELNYLTHSKVF